MQTDEIHHTLTSDPDIKPLFRGVYPRDRFVRLDIDDNGDRPLFFVCNLDTSKEPGSHWIVIEKCGPDVYYFDSYGLPPIHPDLFSKLARITERKLFWNNITLQSFDTNVCGQYCILYCLMRSRHIPFETVIDTLQNNDQLTSHTRDHIISEYINRRYENVIPPNKNIHDINQFLT